MPKTSTIALIGACMLIPSDLSASVIDGINWSITVEAHSEDTAYDISVTSKGGPIPKTLDRCTQLPVTLMRTEVNGSTVTFHTVTVLCKFNELEIPVMAMCHTLSKNHDESLVTFKTKEKPFTVLLRCEK